MIKFYVYFHKIRNVNHAIIHNKITINLNITARKAWNQLCFQYTGTQYKVVYVTFHNTNAESTPYIHCYPGIEYSCIKVPLSFGYDGI